MSITVETKYKAGDEVYDKARPTQKLIVTRFIGGIYYCKIGERSTTKELIYFERDLMSRKIISDT